jgi:hypothetical protein
LKPLSVGRSSEKPETVEGDPQRGRADRQSGDEQPFRRAQRPRQPLVDETDDDEQRDEQRENRPDLAAVDREPRQEDAAHREVGVGKRLQRLAHRRQRVGRRDPEEQLQRQRRVARDLDIGADQTRQQRVAGDAGDAQRDADRCGQRAAGDRQFQRVEHTDQDRARVGVAGVIDE